MMQMRNIKTTKNLYRKKEIALVSYGIAFLGYLVYLFISLRMDQSKNYDAHVYIFNWLGIISFSYIILSWKKLTYRIFTPYIIFMSFFFVFHYGQPIMWAIGIHTPNEIGKQVLYPGLSVPTSADILYAQALTIVSMLMFHFGAVASYKTVRRKKEKKSHNIKISEEKDFQDYRSLKAIFYVCLSIGLISIPLQLFMSFQDFRIALMHGYKALYYSEFASAGASLYSVFLFMFFPCLLGLLIGSKFNKKIRIFVYVVFGIYALLNLFSGDRGSWIYKLIILVWLSHISYKPINIRKLIKYFIVGLLSLYVVYAIVSVRDIGITSENIITALSFENSPIITAVFEMGGSMKPMMVLQKYGWDIWPYGNTYVLAIVGMITNRIFSVIGVDFELLSSFFSQKYLNLSWGAGFSIVSEALLNFGPFFAPLFMIILGWIITRLIDLDLNIEYSAYPLRLFFAAASLEVLISINRNVVHIPIKGWFYGVLLLSVIIIFVRRFIFSYSKGGVQHRSEERNQFAKNN